MGERPVGPNPPAPFPHREGGVPPLPAWERVRARRDLFLNVAPWLVVAVALAVRAVAAAGITFPALDDPAFYFMVASNLAQGRGLVIDAIWSYQVPFEAVAHPSNEYWMPLTSFVLAPALALAGPSYRAAQAVGVVAGTGLVALTFAIVRASPQASKQSWWLGPAAGLLVALNPLLVYQAATADSAVVFSLVAAATVLALARCQGGGPGTWALAGLGLGLAYLTRNDGAFLLPAALVFLWLTARLTSLPSLAVGAGLKPAPTSLVPGVAALLLPWCMLVGAWLVRNTLAFGSPFPASAASVALAADYPSLFRYPAPSFSELLSTVDLTTQVSLRFEALVHNSLGVLGFSLLALTPFAVVGLWLLRREPLFLATILVGAFLMLGSALAFPVASRVGTFYHSVGALLPFLTVAGLAALRAAAGRLERALGWEAGMLRVILGGMLILTAAQLGAAQAAVWKQHDLWAGQFGEAARWLQERDGGAVMTTQPHSLHYASGLPAVMLPAAQPPAVALEAARRYGVRYLVLTERFGRYPAALAEAPPGAFRLVHRVAGLEIYEVTP